MDENIKTLFVKNREEWHDWLEVNHNSTRVVWLLYHKKHTGKPRISYEDAVQEAVCYGWIDSIVRRIDENSYCQKFTPRNSGSRWSVHNIRRAKEMIRLGRMKEAGMKLYQESIDNPSLIIQPDLPIKDIKPPADLISGLKNMNGAFKNFFSFPPSYRKMCILWVESAKRDETRQRRIKEVAEKASRGERIGLK